MKIIILTLVMISVSLGTAETRIAKSSKSKHFTRMEALGIVLSNAMANPIKTLTISIESFENSVKKEQLEEANEAKQVCTANFRKNVSVTGDFGAIIGCDSFSKCHVEATRSVEKLASYASKIDTINGEISKSMVLLKEKRTNRIQQKDELQSQYERFERYKRKNEEHMRNHNEAIDALSNIKSILIKSKTISASKKDELAISREPIAEPIMRFLEKEPRNTLLRAYIVQEIVDIINKLIVSLENASSDQKQQFDLHVSLIEDTISELKEHIGDLSTNIENKEAVLDKQKDSLNTFKGKLRNELRVLNKKMYFCKKSFDIYAQSSLDRADEIKLIMQIKKIILVHTLENKVSRTKSDSKTYVASNLHKEMDQMKEAVKLHDKRKKMNSTEVHIDESYWKKVDEETRKKEVAREEYSKEAERKAQKLQESSNKADIRAGEIALETKRKEQLAKAKKKDLLKKQREQSEKLKSQALQEQKKKRQEQFTKAAELAKKEGRREELSKSDKKLLEIQHQKNDGTETEELKKQIARNAAILQHRNGKKEQEHSEINGEQAIKDKTSRNLKQAVNDISRRFSGLQEKKKLEVNHILVSTQRGSFQHTDLGKRNLVVGNDRSVKSGKNLNDLKIAKQIADKDVDKTEKRAISESITADLNGSSPRTMVQKTKAMEEVKKAKTHQSDIAKKLLSAKARHAENHS